MPLCYTLNLILSFLLYKNRAIESRGRRHRSHKRNINETKIGVIRHALGRAKKPQAGTYQNEVDGLCSMGARGVPTVGPLPRKLFP